MERSRKEEKESRPMASLSSYSINETATSDFPGNSQCGGQMPSVQTGEGKWEARMRTLATKQGVN